VCCGFACNISIGKFPDLRKQQVQNVVAKISLEQSMFPDLQKIQYYTAGCKTDFCKGSNNVVENSW